jgi:tetratricopeptide (TPR) repeat protein
MKTVLILLIILSAVSSALGAEESPQPPSGEANRQALDALFISGVDAFKASEWDVAMQRLNEVLAADPTYTGALNYRALVYVVRKEFDKAMADIDRAIELDPAQYRFARTKGLIYEHLGETQQGIEWYTKALALHGFDAEALEGRIALYVAAGNYENARADCDWLIKYKKTVSNLLRRADVLVALGQTDAAYWDLVGAARLDVTDLRPIIALGDFFLFRRVDLPQAIAYYTAAIEQLSAGPVAHLRRGQAYAALEPPLFAGKALEDFNKYIEVEPDKPEGYAERAKLQLSLGDRVKALADITKALELDPGNEEYTKTLEAIKTGSAEAAGNDKTGPSDSEEEQQ